MKNNILIYLAVLLTVTLPTVMFAQSEQRGIVLEYDNIKHVKTPLANVEVVISDAGSTISDENGIARLISSEMALLQPYIAHAASQNVNR